MNIGIKAAVVAAASVGALALGAAPAFASTGPGTLGAKCTGKIACSYTDPYFGPVKVNETHHGGTAIGNFDTLGATLANADTQDAGYPFTIGWNSDFGTTYDSNTGYIVVQVSPNGLAYNGNAYYDGSASNFAASYPVGDTAWTCKGVHVTNTDLGIKDTETCYVTGVTSADALAYPSGTYSGSPSGNIPFYGNDTWTSDSSDAAVATNWNMQLTENNDGTATVQLTASYAS
jgi:hypothetical protein